MNFGMAVILSLFVFLCVIEAYKNDDVYVFVRRDDAFTKANHGLYCRPDSLSKCGNICISLTKCSLVNIPSHESLIEGHRTSESGIGHMWIIDTYNDKRGQIATNKSIAEKNRGSQLISYQVATNKSVVENELKKRWNRHQIAKQKSIAKDKWKRKLNKIHQAATNKSVAEKIWKGHFNNQPIHTNKSIAEKNWNKQLNSHQVTTNKSVAKEKWKRQLNSHQVETNKSVAEQNRERGLNSHQVATNKSDAKKKWKRQFTSHHVTSNKSIAENKQRRWNRHQVSKQKSIAEKKWKSQLKSHPIHTNKSIAEKIWKSQLKSPLGATNKSVAEKFRKRQLNSHQGAANNSIAENTLTMRWNRHELAIKKSIAKGKSKRKLNKIQLKNVNKKLFSACTKGKLNRVKEYLNLGADINHIGRAGMTPVMIAAIKANLELFTYLEKEGCSFSGVNFINNSVLHNACNGGSIIIVKHLVEKKGFDVNICDRGARGSTPLLLAAMQGTLSVVKYLAKMYLSRPNCDITASDDFGDCLLNNAASGGSTEVVEYVLSLKVFDIDKRGWKNQTSIMDAAREGQIKVVDYLRKLGSNLYLVDGFNNNILHVACTGTSVAMVEHLLAWKIWDIESKGQVGRTPVMVAANAGSVKIVQFLLHYGCNMKAHDDRDNSVLHVAVIQGHINVMKYLLSKGFDIESKGYSGRTAALVAACNRQRKTLLYIWRQGGDLNAKDKYGRDIEVYAGVIGQDMVKFVRSLRRQPSPRV